MSVSRVSALLQVSLSAALYNRVLAKQRSALHYNDELQLPALMAQDVRRILVFQSFTQHVHQNRSNINTVNLKSATKLVLLTSKTQQN